MNEFYDQLEIICRTCDSDNAEAVSKLKNNFNGVLLQKDFFGRRKLKIIARIW